LRYISYDLYTNSQSKQYLSNQYECEVSIGFWKNWIKNIFKAIFILIINIIYDLIWMKGTGPIITNDIIVNIEPNNIIGKQWLNLSQKYPNNRLPDP